MGIKLHVGCGGDIRQGYINIDAHDPRADVQIDLLNISYPEGTVERIEGYMVLEHLAPDEAARFVDSAYRMLRSGGMLILECPDLEKVSRLILLFSHDPDYLISGAFGLRGIFGEPTHSMRPGDYHKWGYTPAIAKRLLKTAGFSSVSISDGASHGYPLRDMRIEAVKK